jgi:hypothetical protein
MAEHVKDWLGAYLDGELQGTRLQAVETHLETCEACRNELQELQKLVEMFREYESIDAFTSAERFATNLTLQLPRLPERSRPRRTGSSAWWLVPVGVTAAWVFLQTLLMISGAVTIFERAGVLVSIAEWLPEGIQHTGIFSTTMTLFGNQLGQGGQEVLSVLDRAYLIGRGFLTPIIWQAVIVLLYWVGMLTWFLRRNRQRFVGNKLVRT